jgi:acetyltransferase-like isoleucine patch superfamily enzyme
MGENTGNGDVMKKRCVFYGASLTTANLIDTLQYNGELGDYEMYAIIDDDLDVQARGYCGYQVIGGFTETSLIKKLYEEKSVRYFSIVLANPAYMTLKWKIYIECLRVGLKPISVIHKESYISEKASLGKGALVLPYSTISTQVEIGENCLVSPSVSIMEGAKIGNNVQLNGNTFIGGNAIIEDNVWIGPSVTIAGFVTIGRNSVVGAGATVLKNIDERRFAAGSPVNLVRKNTVYKDFVD